MTNKPVRLLLVGTGTATLAMCMAAISNAPVKQNPPASPSIIVNDDLDTGFLEAHPSMQPILNLAELKRRLRADTELAKFDASEGFDVSCAAMDVVSEGGWYRVSWRKGDKFGFSSHEQYIPAGTSIIRSCKGGILKAKCGNVIQPTYRGSLDPQFLGEAPILGPHDEDTTLDAAAPQGLLVETPAEPIQVGPNPPWGWNPSVPYGCCGVSVNVVPPTPTAEAPTWEYTIGGMMLLVYSWFTNRRKPKS